MIIVSDASPLMNLLEIGRLDLLGDLYGEILIPGAVLDELCALEGGYAGETLLSEYPFIRSRNATDREIVSSFLLELDEGEAEAIALAVEVKAELLIMDERKGRKTASRLGFKIIGLLGILIQAKENGLIKEVKPVLDELISKARFWVSKPLYDYILERAGE